MGLFEFVFGPRLYMDYSNYMDSVSGKMYKLPNSEQWGEYILFSLQFIWEITFYISPIITAVLYRSVEAYGIAIMSYVKFSAGILFFACIGAGLRTFGRIRSESYRRLVQALKMLKTPQTAEQGRQALSMFDFDFRWWPTDFDVRKIDSNELGESAHAFLEPIAEKFQITKALQYAIGYIIMHSFGIHCIYPGSLKAVQMYLRPNLVDGRAKLILQRGAKRFKLKTIDGNKIDTIFVDNRKKSRNGRTLIISSEGNLSFYEVGVGSTPVGKEYSILGWNHPGFEGSTGKPYPKQEMNAVDAVITFAVKKLHFDLSDIMLYGWSIGGFSTACGATKYNGIKGILLDGTFDDIVELAVLRVPSFLSPLIAITVRCHCNLNNAELLKQYHGPVAIIRRTYDETIARDDRIETNRGNFLAIKLLQHRFPLIFQINQIELVQRILSKPLIKDLCSKEEEAEAMKQLVDFACRCGKSYPILIGETFSEDERNCMAKFLLGKYMRDFKSSHCPRLPLEFFRMPWDIPVN